MSSVLKVEEKLVLVKAQWADMSTLESIPSDFGSVDSAWVGFSKDAVTRYISMSVEAIKQASNQEIHIGLFGTKRVREAEVVLDRILARFKEMRAQPLPHISAFLGDLQSFDQFLDEIGMLVSSEQGETPKKLVRQVTEVRALLEDASMRLAEFDVIRKDTATSLQTAKASIDDALAYQKRAKLAAENAEKAAATSKEGSQAVAEVHGKVISVSEDVGHRHKQIQAGQLQIESLEKRSSELRDALQTLQDQKTKVFIELESKLEGSIQTLISAKSSELDSLAEKHRKSFALLEKDSKNASEKFVSDSSIRLNSLELDGKERIERLLAAATRIGLARSFEDAAAKQAQSAVVFGVLFVVGLCAMGWVGIEHILPLVKASNGWERVLNVFSGALLTAPAVWLAWVSAIRLSDAVRQMSNYRFKTAAALALDGYKKEASEIDPELHKYLVGIAIRHFGEAPHETRSVEAVSPFEGVLDKVMQALTKAKGTQAPEQKPTSTTTQP